MLIIVNEDKSVTVKHRLNFIDSNQSDYSDLHKLWIKLTFLEMICSMQHLRQYPMQNL